MSWGLAGPSGETMAAILVAGNQPRFLGKNSNPRGSDPDNQYRHRNGLRDRPAPGSLIATAVDPGFILIINSSFTQVKNKGVNANV